MAITFNEVSLGRAPFISFEFNNTGAIPRPAGQTYKALVLGQRLSSSPSVANTVVKVSNAQDAINKFGASSQLAFMFETWFANNTSTEVYAGVLDENSSGTARTQTLTFTGPASADGTLNVYFNGIQASVPVVSGMTASQIATALMAKISNIATKLPYTVAQGAGASDHILTATQRWKGESGMDDDIRANYYSTDVLPAGVGLTIAEGTAGATNPVLTNIIAAMGDDQFHIIVNPFTDATSLAALKTEVDRRWSASVQRAGIVFMAKNDSQVDLSSWGTALNSQCFSTIGQQGSPTPNYRWAAAVGAIVAYHGAIDPARPFTNLKLEGIMAPERAKRFTLAEKNSMLYDGISTFNVDDNGYCYMGRQITMYQRNSAGQNDASYLDVPTILTLIYIRWDLLEFIRTKYPRHKLADDGTKFASTQPVVTPNLLKCEIVARCREWELAGLVENTDAFKASIVVERNAQDRNRVDIQVEPDIINMFLLAGGVIKYIL